MRTIRETSENNQKFLFSDDFQPVLAMKFLVECEIQGQEPPRTQETTKTTGTIRTPRVGFGTILQKKKEQVGVTSAKNSWTFPGTFPDFYRKRPEHIPETSLEFPGHFPDISCLGVSLEFTTNFL